ncbi:hypothetical protein JCM8547_006726 [Rhodosporidiobolus lusitaniae]
MLPVQPSEVLLDAHDPLTRQRTHNSALQETAGGPDGSIEGERRESATATTTLATLERTEDVEKVSMGLEGDLEEGAGMKKVETEEEAPARPAMPYFPNGGRAAYSTTAGGVLVLFSTFGLSNSLAAFQAEWTNNQLRQYPPSSISWIGSTHLFILFILGLPMGRLFDRGWFRYQLALGSVLWIGGMFALSESKGYGGMFGSFAVCLGLGLGVMFAPTLSCVASYFSTKRTLMMGCTAGGAAAGATVFPILANHLFASQGFAAGVRALAYIHVGCLVLANLLMRPRSDLPPQKPPPALPLIASFLKQPQTWFACGGAAFVMLGMFIPIFYIQVFAESHNASHLVVTYGLSILNASACVARLTVGLVADRVGNLTTALPVTTLVGVMIFAMLGATSTGGAVAFCVVFGVASGAWVTIMAPSFISIADNVREFGARSGLGMAFVAFACLSGSPIAGAILRSNSSGDNYLGVCLFGGCSTLVGTGMLAFARMYQVRRRGTWKV